MKRISTTVRAKAANIKLLLLDVDGVLTDGRIIIDDRGVETKHFHVRDGQGISLLLRAGIEVGFLTSRYSKSLVYRARELDVKLVRQGVKDKLTTYQDIKRRRGLTDDQIAYLGDDLVDRPILNVAGFAACVADGWHELISSVDFVTSQPGGKGAVREVAEILLRAQGKWSKLTRE